MGTGIVLDVGGVEPIGEEGLIGGRTPPVEIPRQFGAGDQEAAAVIEVGGGPQLLGVGEGFVDGRFLAEQPVDGAEEREVDIAGFDGLVGGRRHPGVDPGHCRGMVGDVGKIVHPVEKHPVDPAQAGTLVLRHQGRGVEPVEAVDDQDAGLPGERGTDGGDRGRKALAPVIDRRDAEEDGASGSNAREDGSCRGRRRCEGEPSEGSSRGIDSVPGRRIAEESVARVEGRRPPADLDRSVDSRHGRQTGRRFGRQCHGGGVLPGEKTHDSLRNRPGRQHPELRVLEVGGVRGRVVEGQLDQQRGHLVVVRRVDLAEVGGVLPSVGPRGVVVRPDVVDDLGVDEALEFFAAGDPVEITVPAGGGIDEGRRARAGIGGVGVPREVDRILPGLVFPCGPARHRRNRSGGTRRTPQELRVVEARLLPAGPPAGRSAVGDRTHAAPDPDGVGDEDQPRLVGAGRQGDRPSFGRVGGVELEKPQETPGVAVALLVDFDDRISSGMVNREEGVPRDRTSPAGPYGDGVSPRRRRVERPPGGDARREFGRRDPVSRSPEARRCRTVRPGAGFRVPRLSIVDDDLVRLHIAFAAGVDAGAGVAEVLDQVLVDRLGVDEVLDEIVGVASLRQPLTGPGIVVPAVRLADEDTLARQGAGGRVGRRPSRLGALESRGRPVDLPGFWGNGGRESDQIVDRNMPVRRTVPGEDDRREDVSLVQGVGQRQQRVLDQRLVERRFGGQSHPGEEFCAPNLDGVDTRDREPGPGAEGARLGRVGEKPRPGQVFRFHSRRDHREGASVRSAQRQQGVRGVASSRIGQED